MHRHIPFNCVLVVLFLLSLAACRVTHPIPPVPTVLPPLSVADLVAILNNPDAQGRDLTDAANELQHWGAAGAPAVPGLRRALRYSYSYDARVSAAITLVAIGPPAKEAIPDLVETLDDQTPINAYAALALGSIGDAARCAIPRLAQALTSPDSMLRSSAAIALDALSTNNLVDSVDRQAITAAPDHIAVFDDTPEGSVSARARRWWDQVGKQQAWGTRPCTP